MPAYVWNIRMPIQLSTVYMSITEASLYECISVS